MKRIRAGDLPPKSGYIVSEFPTLKQRMLLTMAYSVFFVDDWQTCGAFWPAFRSTCEFAGCIWLIIQMVLTIVLVGQWLLDKCSRKVTFQ